MNILQLENVSRRFGGLVAVDAVSLDVPANGITAIIGPNGAGKTTLFNVISGFLTPSAGRVIFCGRDITGLPPETVAQGGLVRTFQLVHLFENLTVLENVKVGQHLHTQGGLLSALMRFRSAHTEADVEKASLALLEQVGLVPQRDLPAGVLPYAESGSLKSPARSPQSPNFCCSTNPQPGSIATRRPTSRPCCVRLPRPVSRCC